MTLDEIEGMQACAPEGATLPIKNQPTPIENQHARWRKYCADTKRYIPFIHYLNGLEQCRGRMIYRNVQYSMEGQ